MKRKLIISIIVLLIIAFVGVVIFYGYLYIKQKPLKEVAQKAFTDDIEDLKKVASDELLRKLNESPSNPSYLESNVANYKTTTTISETKAIEQKETTAKLEIQVIRTTTNTKTNFSTTSTETYQISLIKENNNWKIQDINLIGVK